jgi:hypothetical protein
MILEGTILRGRAFEAVEGRVVVEDGEIEAIEETDSRSDDVILPTFVNAHTHVGDAIAKEAGRGLSLEDLVAPPDGLKHRLLAEADRDDQIEAIRRSLAFMAETGTIAHLDFREGGVEGVEVLEDAVRSVPIDPVILARESVAAMEAGDGFGASGANDGDFSRQRNATRRADKLFGIHAGEAARWSSPRSSQRLPPRRSSRWPPTTAQNSPAEGMVSSNPGGPGTCKSSTGGRTISPVPSILSGRSSAEPGLPTYGRSSGPVASRRAPRWIGRNGASTRRIGSAFVEPSAPCDH